MPITSGERLTIEPKEKSQNAGLSITLTGTPARRASAANAAASRVVLERADGKRGAVEIGGFDGAAMDRDVRLRAISIISSPGSAA